MNNITPITAPRQPHAAGFLLKVPAGVLADCDAQPLVPGVPISVTRAATVAYKDTEFIDAADELRSAARRGRLPRGPKAIRREQFVSRQVASALVAMGFDKLSGRVERCGAHYGTAGCPEGHGGVIVNRRTYLCGLAVCPNCCRQYSKRLRRAFNRMTRSYVPRKGRALRFVTVSLRPRRTHKESWDAIKKVRRNVMGFIKGINGGSVDAVGAIEFGASGHPHFHVMVDSAWIVRDALSRKLVGWTGGKVVELPEDEWVPLGKFNKRGKQKYRTWQAVGGDWYVDVREVKGGIDGGAREVLKYLTNPFGGAGSADNARDRDALATSARMMVQVYAAGLGSHRVQGYGAWRGIVSEGYGKRETRPCLCCAGTKVMEMQSTLGTTYTRPCAECNGTGRAPPPERPSAQACPTCRKPMVMVPCVDRAAYRYFNRNNPVWLSRQAAAHTPELLI